MNESKRAEPQDDPCLPRQVDQLLSKYVSDPQSPRPEEVQRMVGELRFAPERIGGGDP